jgi:hypothetical protein
MKKPKDPPPQPRHVKLRDAKRKGDASEYRVVYPSGRDFRLTGVYGQAMKGHELLGPTIRTADDKVVVLDPRGLVIRGDLVVDSPRDIISSPAETPIVLPNEMREWMRAHPEWPPIDWFKEGS